MSDIGLFLVCKNNYNLLELFLETHDYQNLNMLILDLGSSQENLQKGYDLSNKHKFHLELARTRSMQDNFAEAVDYFEKIGIYFFIYSHQDVYPLTPNWLDVLKVELASLSSQNFGLAGFNVYHDYQIALWREDRPELMTTARTPLEKGNGYYDIRPGSRVNYKNFKFGPPFLVEIPFWSTCLVNVSTFKQAIVVDERFEFFHAIDDLAFQFISSDVPNIVLPRISFAHDQSMKVANGFTKNSSTDGDKKTIIKNYGRIDHLDVWREKWGFDYSSSKSLTFDSYFIARVIDKIEQTTGLGLSNNLPTLSRRTFANSGHKSSVLVQRFFNHDPATGPLDYF